MCGRGWSCWTLCPRMRRSFAGSRGDQGTRNEANDSGAAVPGRRLAACRTRSAPDPAPKSISGQKDSISTIASHRPGCTRKPLRRPSARLIAERLLSSLGACRGPAPDVRVRRSWVPNRRHSGQAGPKRPVSRHRFPARQSPHWAHRRCKAPQLTEAGPPCPSPPVYRQRQPPDHPAAAPARGCHA